MYIPVAPLVLDVLHQCAALPKPRSSSGKPLVFGLALKVNKESLGTLVVQTGIVKRALEVLLDVLKSQFNSISFPELVRTWSVGWGIARLRWKVQGLRLVTRPDTPWLFVRGCRDRYTPPLQ